jgi:hypothetical protein
MTNLPMSGKISAFDRKMLVCLYAFFSLKVTFIAFIVGLFLIVLLYVASVILGALVELGTTIAQTYNGCTSIEKLLALVIVLVCINKVAPPIIRTARTWKGF